MEAFLGQYLQKLKSKSEQGFKHNGRFYPEIQKPLETLTPIVVQYTVTSSAFSSAPILPWQTVFSLVHTGFAPW